MKHAPQPEACMLHLYLDTCIHTHTHTYTQDRYGNGAPSSEAAHIPPHSNFKGKSSSSPSSSSSSRRESGRFEPMPPEAQKGPASPLVSAVNACVHALQM